MAMLLGKSCKLFDELRPPFGAVFLLPFIPVFVKLVLIIGGFMGFLQGYSRKLGVSKYLGTWDALTNTPTLLDSVGQKGDYYIVSVAGTTNLNGISEWQPEDWVIYSGTAWQKLDHSEIVEVVNSTEGNQPDKAPSVRAIKLYIQSVGTESKNRSFHVGTQLSETISDLEQTVTSLTASSFGEYGDVVFQYPDENGKITPTLSPTGILPGTYNTLTVDNKGRVISGIYNQSNNPFIQSLATTQINTTTLTSFIDVNGLVSSTLLPGLYKFTFIGLAHSTSTTTGIGVKLVAKTASISTIYAKYSITQSVPGTLQSYEYDQISQNTNITSTSVSSTSLGFVIKGEGIVRVVSNGTLAMQFKSEINDSAVSISEDCVLLLEKV